MVGCNSRFSPNLFPKIHISEATHMMWHPKDWSGTQWSPLPNRKCRNFTRGNIMYIRIQAMHILYIFHIHSICIQTIICHFWLDFYITNSGCRGSVGFSLCQIYHPVQALFNKQPSWMWDTSRSYGWFFIGNSWFTTYWLHIQVVANDPLPSYSWNLHVYLEKYYWQIRISRTTK